MEPFTALVVIFFMLQELCTLLKVSQKSCCVTFPLSQLAAI